MTISKRRSAYNDVLDPRNKLAKLPFARFTKWIVKPRINFDFQKDVKSINATRPYYENGIRKDTLLQAVQDD